LEDKFIILIILSGKFLNNKDLDGVYLNNPNFSSELLSFGYNISWRVDLHDVLCDRFS